MSATEKPMSVAEKERSKLKDSTSRNGAISQLRIISREDGPEEILAAAGLIPALIEIFVETPPTDWHIECLLDIFKDLASCDKTCSALTKDSGMISELMSYSRKEDKGLAKRALKVLGGLACFPQEREILLKEGVFSLCSMITTTRDKDLLAPLVTLINNLLYRNKQIGKQCIEMKVIPTLMDLLLNKDNHTYFSRTVMYLMGNFVLSEEGIQAVLTTGRLPDFLNFICEQADRFFKDPLFLKRALIFIQILSQHEAARKKILENPEVILKCLDSTGVINDRAITIDFVRTFAEKKDSFAALFEVEKYSHNVWRILSDRMEKGAVPISTAEGTSAGGAGACFT